MNARVAIYPGSFDPPTNGHLWMIETGSQLFDQLHVVIMRNPGKNPRFQIDERVKMLRTTTHCFENVKVSVGENVYTVEMARRLGAKFILRGLRSGTDFDFEHMLRNVNGDMGREVETVFLTPPRDLAEVSSSLVMGLVGPEGWEGVVRRYVPRSVFERVRRSGNRGIGEKIRWELWHQFKEHLGASGDYNADKLLAELKKMYAPATDRVYHTWAHVEEGFKELYGMPNEMFDKFESVKEITTLVLAWLFHDCICVPGNKANEEMSAATLVSTLQKMAVPNDVFTAMGTRASWLILLTKHPSNPKSFAEKLIVDLDLAILGQSPEIFDDYEEDIFSEYQVVAPTHVLAGKRLEFVWKMLDLPTIYHTDYFREKYEDKARANLQRSAERLSRTAAQK